MPNILSGPWGVVLTVGLLVVSNFMMLVAWYWHLKFRPADGSSSLFPFLIILASWGIAFFEYCIAVPANRIGASAGLNMAQLKIIQEVVTVAVFIPFLLFFMREQWKWDYLWALLCMVGAVFFVFRSKLGG